VLRDGGVLGSFASATLLLLFLSQGFTSSSAA
jgi:hypothetical protein